MPRISIRYAESNELTRILYITKLAYKVPYKENTPVTAPHEPVNIRERFLKNEIKIVVAILDNKIVGSVRYELMAENCLYLNKLAVLKTHRNKGIGSALIKEVEKIAANKHYREIRFDCLREKKLPNYYKKLGYIVERIKKHRGYHEVYMSKRVK